MIFPILTSKSRKHKTSPLTGKAQMNHFALSCSSAALCAQTHSYFKLRILTACFKVFYTKSVRLLFKPGENKQTENPHNLMFVSQHRKNCWVCYLFLNSPGREAAPKQKLKCSFTQFFFISCHSCVFCIKYVD